MPKGRIVLLAALGVVAVVEAVGIFTDSDAVSGLTADLFHADTPLGRGVFAGVWAGFSAWYLIHVWRFRKSVKAAGSNTAAHQPLPKEKK